ncbi:MAG: Hsp20/alpha crystallin family protein [Planctomycetota bacterium]|nr:Hsp20/alpha crystallin family protein [Planctomycetota bacterium]
MAEKKEKMTVHAGPVSRRQEDSFMPLVDIYETADGMTVLESEIPGAKPESVDIRVDRGVLTISASGELPEMSEAYSRTYTGFASGEYFRAFALSDEVDRDKIEASLSDGVLTVRLPKAAAAQTRKIEIKEG